MHCVDARPRLVAWQDDELAPSERVMLERHLDGCSACRTHASRLEAVTPEPSLEHPGALRGDFWSRLDEAVEQELRRPLAPPAAAPLQERISDWLSQERRVSLGSMVAYAAVLAAVVSFGASTWLENRDLRLALSTEATMASSPPPITIPADQFRPTAWTPAESATKPTDPTPSAP
jgi:anti-sigma factor RsiW